MSKGIFCFSCIIRKAGGAYLYGSYNEDDFCLKWIDAPDKIDDDFLDGTW